MGGSGDLETSDNIVRKTLEIAAAFGSPPLFLENPYTGQLQNRITNLPLQKSRLLLVWLPLPHAHSHMDEHWVDTGQAPVQTRL